MQQYSVQSNAGRHHHGFGSSVAKSFYCSLLSASPTPDLVDSMRESEVTCQCCWMWPEIRPSSGLGRFPGRPRRQRAVPAESARVCSQDLKSSSSSSTFYVLHLEFGCPHYLPVSGGTVTPSRGSGVSKKPDERFNQCFGACGSKTSARLALCFTAVPQLGAPHPTPSTPKTHPSRLSFRAECSQIERGILTDGVTIGRKQERLWSTGANRAP